MPPSITLDNHACLLPSDDEAQHPYGAAIGARNSPGAVKRAHFVHTRRTASVIMAAWQPETWTVGLTDSDHEALVKLRHSGELLVLARLAGMEINPRHTDDAELIRALIRAANFVQESGMGTGWDPERD